MSSLFDDARRASRDAASALTFRSSKILPIEDRAGPWAFAVATAFLGAVITQQYESPSFGWWFALATGVAIAVSLRLWSVMGREGLQRSYVTACLAGAELGLSALLDVLHHGAILAVDIAGCAWFCCAWLIYMGQRERTGN